MLCLEDNGAIPDFKVVKEQVFSPSRAAFFSLMASTFWKLQLLLTPKPVVRVMEIVVPTI